MRIISDCTDQNAVLRQVSRCASLLGLIPIYLRVSSCLEAAGNLIDLLDSIGDTKGTVLVNVAPRNGKSKKWENGSPFCYFFCKKVLVISSVEGLTLSLVKKFKLAREFTLLHTTQTVSHLIEKGILRESLREHVINTQFRSFEFVPLVAGCILKFGRIPGISYSFSEIPKAPNAVWWVDNFGNCKTTMFKEEMDSLEKFKGIPYIPKLADVPEGMPAFVRGSSGLLDKRFLELVVQGKSASQYFGIKSGDLL